MCGKFTQMSSWRELVAFSQPLVVESGRGGAQDDEDIVSTPMRFANIMRLNAARQREMASMRWGFSKVGATSPMRPDYMHARAETIDTRPTFRDSFAERRGVLPVVTFNEGEELPNGRTKQWVISPRDRRPIFIAVIWEEWRNADQSLLTFVQVTTPANTLISRITDRMPAILPGERAIALWLGEEWAPLPEIKALLRTYEDGGNWEMTEQPPRPRKKK